MNSIKKLVYHQDRWILLYKEIMAVIHPDSFRPDFDDWASVYLSWIAYVTPSFGDYLLVALSDKDVNGHCTGVFVSGKGSEPWQSITALEPVSGMKAKLPPDWVNPLQESLSKVLPFQPHGIWFDGTTYRFCIYKDGCSADIMFDNPDNKGLNSMVKALTDTVSKIKEIGEPLKF